MTLTEGNERGDFVHVQETTRQRITQGHHRLPQFHIRNPAAWQAVEAVVHVGGDEQQLQQTRFCKTSEGHLAPVLSARTETNCIATIPALAIAFGFLLAQS